MHQITILTANKAEFVPKPAFLKRCATLALEGQANAMAMTIKIVDQHEMTELNSIYRKKQGPTNVLSFPLASSFTENKKRAYLGDLAICAEVVNEEARVQHKLADAHWAHMTIHGTLHLLGFDHENEQDAEVMEAREIDLLKKLGFANPYLGE